MRSELDIMRHGYLALVYAHAFFTFNDNRSRSIQEATEKGMGGAYDRFAAERIDGALKFLGYDVFRGDSKLEAVSQAMWLFMAQIEREEKRLRIGLTTEITD